MFQSIENIRCDINLKPETADANDLGPVGEHLLEFPQGGRFHHGNVALDSGDGTVGSQGGPCIPTRRGDTTLLASGTHVRDRHSRITVLETGSGIAMVQFQPELIQSGSGADTAGADDWRFPLPQGDLVLNCHRFHAIRPLPESHDSCLPV